MASKSNKSSRQSGEHRIKFKKAVINAIASRVDRQCSVPRCKRPAMGPIRGAEGAINLGKACHIYSASVNGPRGRGGKDDAFIESEKNGIWCCPHHSDLIDKKDGVDFPAEVLFRWKALAEARVYKRLTDSLSPLGWVDSIAFEHYDMGAHLPKAKLSAFTLLTGQNGVGKSNLMRVAAGVSQSKFVEGFAGATVTPRGMGPRSARLKAKIIYSTVDTLQREVFIEVEGKEIKRTDGIVPCILPPGDIEVIYLSDSRETYNTNEDEVDYFQRILSIDRSGLNALAKIGASKLLQGLLTIERGHVWDDKRDRNVPRCKEDGSAFMEVNVQMKHHKEPLSFAALSSSEKTRVLLELLISKAREICKQKLTLLLIDSVAFTLDKHNFKTLLETLAGEDFQSVVTLPPRSEGEVYEIVNERQRLLPQEYLRPWRLEIVEKIETV